MKLIFNLFACVVLGCGGLAFAAYQNDSEETKELLKRTHAEDVEAMEKMGDIYRDGQGVTADKTEAMNWYAFAAERGSKTAHRKLWALERNAKKAPKAKKYNDEATRLLCSYLHIANKNTSGKSLIEAGILPESMVGKSLNSGKMVYAPTYNAAEVRKLLKKGADPTASIPVEELNIGKDRGSTVKVLYEVLKAEDYKTAEYLLSQGAVIHEGATDILDLALARMQDRDGKPGSDKMIKFLLAHGGDLKLHSDWGSTLLMDASIHARLNAAKFLIENGAAVDDALDKRYIVLGEKKMKTIWPETALWMAARNQNIEMVDFLLKSGADPNFTVNGESLLTDLLRRFKGTEAETTTYDEELSRLKSSARTSALNPVLKGDVTHLIRLSGGKETKANKK